MLDYRDRIYKYYVSGRPESLAPENIQGLKTRESRLKQLIYNYLPSNHEAKILDLGCGHGALIYFARKIGYLNIVGVDYSGEQVEAAKKLGIEGIQQGDLMEHLYLVTNDSLDVVITYDVIEHFKKEELLPFVDEVFRVLKSGGHWIIHTPNGEAIFGSRMLYSDFTHELAFTRTSITQLLKSSSFQKVMCFEDEPFIYGIKSAIRWFLWKIIRLILKFYLIIETGGADKGCIFSQNFVTVALK